MTKTIQKANTRRSEPQDVLTTAPSAHVALTIEADVEAASLPNQPLADAQEDAIRTLAHSKWEAAGCPSGDGVDFWLEAEREVRAGRIESTSAQG